eukprot:scaffold1181_cov152-Amphora_coffeaeformis.AAC.9
MLIQFDHGRTIIRKVECLQLRRMLLPYRREFHRRRGLPFRIVARPNLGVIMPNGRPGFTMGQGFQDA